MLGSREEEEAKMSNERETTHYVVQHLEIWVNEDIVLIYEVQLS